MSKALFYVYDLTVNTSRIFKCGVLRECIDRGEKTLCAIGRAKTRALLTAFKSILSI